MKRTIQLLAAFCCLIPLSILAQDLTKKSNFQPGVYGINGSESVILELREDHEFYYMNESDPSKQVEATGKWSQNGNQIILSEYPEDQQIADTWKIDPDQPCIRSQMTDFLVIRLCLTS